ncbi:glycoprotein-N-acetylgalactosamine 3-beta-galactosyltransferase 1-like [Salvia splendens]|uniref:glycoprotein-N-acetylgalactosamine 3-beta-galactosyltransferase 1-like n=1 Tax=Salvia splendens TaxID=180675 RepID=UPI001C279569|nr:glycoprotein-N-acetylgalactosamine 3-beta-galactosyltransferase 1-like [Salvia splendens]
MDGQGDRGDVQGGEVRWYVMTDDDTVLFVDNLVGVLSKYDHNKYFYVGMNSECFVCNVVHSFGMAFGGGGYALSYPLAKAVAENMDLCLKRYPFLYGSDLILQSCIADLGVSLTQEPDIRMSTTFEHNIYIDFTGDISGLLSAHPHSPLVSLHHLDAVEPLFPSTNRTESLSLLKQAAAVDESRLLQPSTCYLKKYN